MGSVSFWTAVSGAAARRRAAHVYGRCSPSSEVDHDRTVLLAGAYGSPTLDRLCLAQADRVLAVTRAGPWTADHAARSPARSWYWWTAPGPRQTTPPGSSRWRRGEHTAWAGPRGLDRLASRVAGRAVGVVLSGGGARAFAHIGALAEIDAAGS